MGRRVADLVVQELGGHVISTLLVQRIACLRPRRKSRCPVTAVAVAAWTGGELFLAAMGAIGCLMTLWVGGLTLFRG